MGSLYLGLVHHPIQNKNNELVTTSVTNMDIHDISRSCRTFGVKNYFIITPLMAQQKLVNRILGHWETETGLAYNPDRGNALAIARIADSVDKAMDAIEEAEGQRPKLVMTGANFSEYDGDHRDLKKKINIDNTPYFLIFGTGWGLHAELVKRSDYKLQPIEGTAFDSYNHLSVRSAVAIYLDRLRFKD